MLYEIKVTPIEYEEIFRLIIFAENEEEALFLAKEEVREHDFMSSEEKKFEIERLVLRESKIIATEINW